MKKILIFGNSGAGKSTLAKKLQNKFNLELLDLDTLAWLDVVPPERKLFNESTNEIDHFQKDNASWVIEGCYADLLEHASIKANEIIFLNPGTDVCVRHCKSRPWEPHKYISKKEQDKNLDMLIDWVKQYDERDDEFSLKSHKALYEKLSGNKIEIKEGQSYPL